eukprot:scaffold22621_cov50-Phaeocystis_antarctica.AAC.2
MHRDAGAVWRVRAAVRARAGVVARQAHAAVGQVARLAARCPDPKTVLHIAPYKMAHDYGPPHAVSPNGTCNSQNSPNTGDRAANKNVFGGMLLPPRGGGAAAGLHLSRCSRPRCCCPLRREDGTACVA